MGAHAPAQAETGAALIGGGPGDVTLRAVLFKSGPVSASRPPRAPPGAVPSADFHRGAAILHMYEGRARGPPGFTACRPLRLPGSFRPAVLIGVMCGPGSPLSPLSPRLCNPSPLPRRF